MTERELEERLRTWYRSRTADAPPALVAAVGTITNEAEAGPRSTPRLQMLAAVVVTLVAVGAVGLGGALVGTFLREPAPVVPDASATPSAGPLVNDPVLGRFDACLTLSRDALDRLFPGVMFTVRGGGPELAAETGDWSPEWLGVPVRSCLYEADGLAIAVHVPIESARLGEVTFIARRFLGADFSADAWPWSVEREDGSAALIVTRSSAEQAGYLVALTMRIPDANGPAIEDIGVEVVNGVNPFLVVPDPCDLLEDVTDGLRPDAPLVGDEDWRTCRVDGSAGLAGEVFVFDRLAAVEQAEERLVQSDVPGMGVLERHGDRWRTRGAVSGLHAVGVSCEPLLFIASATSEAAAADLADRIAETACPGGAGAP